MGESDLVHLHRLHRVVRLELAECEGVTSKTLSALHGLDFLTDLNLDRLNHYRIDRPLLTSTFLTNASLVHVLALPRLEALSLAGNLITDQGLSQLAGLPGLKRLDLSATEVSDAGLVHLIAMKRLATVNLAAIRITKQGLAQLQNARPDLTIELEIPPDVAEGVERVRGATK
jgi:Leucine-rich repeat (LRR) protein